MQKCPVLVAPPNCKWQAGSDMLPPRRPTPAAVSVPAEKERARNWEEHKQQTNWAQAPPTHGSETSPNRTHNNTQGNHEVRAVQQPPNAAHAERAISKHPHPSLYKVPTYSTRAGAAPRALGGARHGGSNNSRPRTGQSTWYGDVKSSYGGAGGWDRRGCATWAPRSATRQGEEQHRHTERGSHTKRDKGEHTFCRPLRPVLLLVSFLCSRSPVVGMLGLCWMWHGVPFARQRRPIVCVLKMCWLLPGSFDCFCCPHASVHRPSIACLAVFLCA